MAETAREILHERYQMIKAAHATTPNLAAEWYELNPGVHAELMTWAQEQAQSIGSAGVITADMLTAQLYFTLLFGAALHQEGVIP